MYLQLDICICQRNHLLELTEHEHLSWDVISSIMDFDQFSELVESDRND